MMDHYLYIYLWICTMILVVGIPWAYWKKTTGRDRSWYWMGVVLVMGTPVLNITALVLLLIVIILVKLGG